MKVNTELDEQSRLILSGYGVITGVRYNSNSTDVFLETGNFTVPVPTSNPEQGDRCIVRQVLDPELGLYTSGKMNLLGKHIINEWSAEFYRIKVYCKISSVTKIGDSYLTITGDDIDFLDKRVPPGASAWFVTEFNRKTGIVKGTVEYSGLVARVVSGNR